MMLVIGFPDNCHTERRWIGAVLLQEFLGLPHEIRFDGESTIRISAGGKTLEIADSFLARVADAWLCAAALRDKALPQWRVADSGLAARTVEPSVPVLFGAPGFEMRDADNAALHLDVFGSAFFMLSRYEEAVNPERDEHDRFPSTASLAGRQGFLCRPVVDEYMEILWAAMLRLWPRLRRRERCFGSRITCDVDHPYHPAATSFIRLLKRTAGEAIRKRTVTDGIRPVRNYLAGRNGDWRHDPYYHTVDWMMDVNEKAGNTVGFYFIPEITDPVMDGTCSPTEPAVKSMMKRIAHRGHEIGIHPGYGTYRSKERLVSGKSRLQRILDGEGIRQKVAGGRQHYLRWSTRTPAAWNAAGLEYDSTLSYADHAGFRCGTCHEYTMYDLHRREALTVTQRPLICMESSVIAYMRLGYTESALDKMKELKGIVRKFDGKFTLLWHNSCFENDLAREMYREILAC